MGKNRKVYIRKIDKDVKWFPFYHQGKVVINNNLVFFYGTPFQVKLFDLYLTARS